MISQISVIDYKGYKIRHFADSTMSRQLVFMHTEDTGEDVLPKEVVPAIGGCRIKTNISLEEACEEVYGLATEMAFKMARAGLNGGGAKIVVFRGEKDTQLLHDVGEFVEHLHQIGIPYITSVDVGTTPEDMKIVGEKTQWVSHCDPSPYTARGVESAIVAYASMIHTPPKFLSVFIRGLGSVGSALALGLREHGFIVFGCDKYLHLKPKVEEALKARGVQIVPAIDNYFPRAHIYAPCAFGGEVSEMTIPRIKEAGIRVIIGSSNRVLKEGTVNAIELHQLLILLAIDHIVNRCGLLRVAAEFSELFHFTLEDCEREVGRTGVINREMFEMSLRENLPMTEVEKRYFAGIKTAA